MRQSSLSFRRRKINLRSSLALLFAAFGASLGVAQDIPLGVTYICSGEHIYIENCNIRDLGDNANCMVAHPDKLLPNGMNSYGGNAPAMVTASGELPQQAQPTALAACPRQPRLWETPRSLFQPHGFATITGNPAVDGTFTEEQPSLEPGVAREFKIEISG
jgi:hypothetical protein